MLVGGGGGQCVYQFQYSALFWSRLNNFLGFYAFSAWILVHYLVSLEVYPRKIEIGGFLPN